MSVDHSRETFALFLPILGAELYLLTTYVLFVLGPLVWPVDNYGQLTLFVLSCYAMFGAGAVVQLARGMRRGRFRVLPPWTAPLARRHRVLLIVSAVFAIFTAGVIYIGMTGDYSLSVDHFLESAQNPGESYQRKRRALEYVSPGLRLASMATTYLAVLSCFYIPVGVYYWKQIGWFSKGLIVTAASANIAAMLAGGTNTGIGNILLQLLAVGSILWSARVFQRKRQKRSRRGLIFVGSAVIAYFVYFGSAQMSRVEQTRGPVAAVYTRGVATVDRGNPLLVFGGDGDGVEALSMVFYTSHGYYGLAQNLKQPFRWTYGIGNSVRTSQWVEKNWNTRDIFALTHPYRTQQATGWPALSVWSTIFPWYAGDLTWFGVLVAMFFLGWFFSYVWLDCLSTGSPFALAWFGRLSILVAFIPCNNQIMQTLGAAFATVSLALLYFASKVLPRLSWGR